MGFGRRRVKHPAGSGHTFGFLAVPSLNAVIIEGERAGVASDSFDLAATHWIDEWTARLSEFLVRDRPLPRDALLLEADPDVPYPSGSVLSAQHLDVVWVSATTPMRLVGRADMMVRPGAPLLPVTQTTWFELDADAEVSAVYTPTALVEKRLWPAFDRFGTRVLELAILTEVEAPRTSQARRRSAREARQASVSGALRGGRSHLSRTIVAPVAPSIRKPARPLLILLPKGTRCLIGGVTEDREEARDGWRHQHAGAPCAMHPISEPRRSMRVHRVYYR